MKTLTFYEEEYFSKPNNVVDNNGFEKTVYDKLATKVSATDTSEFVLKTHYDTRKLSLQKKLMRQIRKHLILVDLFKKDYNTKNTEVEGKMS